MPWFLLLALNSYHDGVFMSHDPPSQKVIKALVAKLASDTELGLRKTQVRKLTHTLRALDGQISTVLRNNPPKFDREEVWRGFAESTEFALGAASLREMCHNNLLFGFEHYCKSCLDGLPAVDAPASKKSSPTFLERFAARFGKEVSGQVHDSEIMLAREVRHAFVHRGGRVDQKLKDAGISAPLGEKVTITVDLLRDLAEGLRSRVDLLTDESLKILKEERI
jgi:hypothetical protein